MLEHAILEHLRTTNAQTCLDIQIQNNGNANLIGYSNSKQSPIHQHSWDDYLAPAIFSNEFMRIGSELDSDYLQKLEESRTKMMGDKRPTTDRPPDTT